MNIIPFEFNDKTIRTLTGDDGQPRFVAVDVCRALELDQVSRAVSRLDDDERGVTTVTTPGGPQQAAIVTISGLYHLIFTSRKHEAVQFRRWVTDEVLPAIFMTGQYVKDAEQAKALLTETVEVSFKLQDYLPAGTYTSKQVWDAYKKACDTVIDLPGGKKHGMGSHFREAFCALSAKHAAFFEAQTNQHYGKYTKGSIILEPAAPGDETAWQEMGYQ